MKRLYLLRHAKSVWNDPSLDDFDRPLATRGRRAAPRMGRHMRNLGYFPDVALCSPAVRARETWFLVRDELGRDVAEAYPPGLYHAESRMLLDAIRGLDDEYESAVLIGHNPGLLTLALGLVRRGLAAADPFGKYPTAALTVFEFDVDRWTGVAPGQGRLVCFVRPKDLDGTA